jgi:hypothetical protein
MESHQKGFLELMCFSLLEILTSPFISRDSWSFSFSFSLFFLYAPSLEDSMVLTIFEEKITSSKTSF